MFKFEVFDLILGVIASVQYDCSKAAVQFITVWWPPAV